MNIKEQKRLQVSLRDMPIYFAVMSPIIAKKLEVISHRSSEVRNIFSKLTQSLKR